LSTQTLTYFPDTINRTLPHWPKELLDTITFFRIPNLYQLFPQIIPLIAAVLKPGGLFVDSGSFHSPERIAALISGFPLKITRAVPLFDYSSYMFSPKHIGFIIQKT